LAQGRAPEIETARLRLRSFRKDDRGPHAESFADPRVYQHLTAKALTREESWRKMLAVCGLWPMLGYGYWAVERKSDGGYIGHVGFADFERDLEPSLGPVPEMGWIMSADAHGQGYASEAVAAALEWAEANLEAPRYCCIIAPANTASIKVALRAGFVEAARSTYHGAPTVIFYREARKARA
jgi:RimJ/RimL family protein N-acetyltransferase